MGMTVLACVSGLKHGATNKGHNMGNCSGKTGNVGKTAELQGDKITLSKEEADDLSSWNTSFTELQQKQLKALREDEAVKAHLQTNGLTTLFRAWSDIGRAVGSCIGDNITDMQFFALSACRPANTSHVDLPSDHFVAFPAIRPPNYSDEVAIRSPADVTFRARDRFGDVDVVTLQQFLKNLGDYVTDLPESADWSDPVDNGPMQAAAQFSMLPAPTGRADLGVAAFGYQAKNLHIIIGPGGEIGWSPEGHGATRIFFRDADELRAVSLVPEDRKEVKQAFFEAPQENETIEQEAERYKQVENRLIHIQVEMVRPAGAAIARQEYTGSVTAGAGFATFAPQECMGATGCMLECDLQQLEGCYFEDEVYRSCEFSTMQCDLQEASLDEGACDLEAMDQGLNLARVTAGDVVGTSCDADRVPQANGKYATRSPGVSTRMTEMYYAVSADGEVTADRVHRFLEQMSFERRARELDHGSLVTGLGTWTARGEEAPIVLKPLPADMRQLIDTFVQWPSQSIHAFTMGGQGSTDPQFLRWLRALAIGGEPTTPPGGGAPEIMLCRESEDVIVARLAEK